ncbi:MAG: TIR domain-containing protein [Vitreimonas sp.]
MTVFVAHAPADRPAAEALEKVIERRGQFVELDDGVVALRPIRGGDVLVLLVSQALMFAPARLRIEQRALDAWADARLVVVRLDKGLAPVGLRDLPFIDASFEAQRAFKWNEAADAVREKLKARSAAPLDADDGEAPPPPKALRKRTVAGALLSPLLALPGVLAIAATLSIWLANRIGPTPGGWPELRRGIDQFGMRYGLPSGLTEWLFAIAIALTAAILVFAVARLLLKMRPPLRRTEPSEPAPKPTEAVFVSYARANEKQVLPVIEGAKQGGRTFWVDQKGGVTAGDGWAGEIVRAIRGSAGVVVMCSKAAFESDHVKREVYLADRYKKKLAPVFIEAAEPPEDFEYFFAGVQPLKLFETPEAERPEALIRVLGASS